MKRKTYLGEWKICIRVLKAKLAATALKNLFREAYVSAHTTNCIVRFCHGLREGEGEREIEKEGSEMMRTREWKGSGGIYKGKVSGEM